MLLGHVSQVGGISEEDEKAASRWAEDTLIPERDFAAFRAADDYAADRVSDFAKNLGIAPGIVVGRMQREGMMRYNMLNNLKEQYTEVPLTI